MSGLRILVIDDSLTIRKLVEIALRGTAHTIDYAANGQAGIDRARAQMPDLVMCDFVLPDRRGSDVCRQLVADAQGRTPTLVVMSGKRDEIRGQFADLKIFHFLVKPFTAEEIHGLVARVTPRPAPTFVATRGTALSLAGSFRAALYQVLCDRLARIPAWSQELGPEEPATFFARKLFTESVLAELFESLLPIYQQTRPRIHDRQLVAEGTLDVFRPARLLDLAVTSGLTTELTIHNDRGTTVFFTTSGRLYTPDKGPNPASGPRGLAEALHGRDGRFTLRRIDLLPPEVCGEPVHVTQLALECLRLDPELPLPAAAQVLARIPGFSERIAELQLDDDEQRVVQLIDGVSTMADVVRRAGGTPIRAQLAIARMIELGLLRARQGDGPAVGAPNASELVVVVDRQDEAFHGPLGRHLATSLPHAGVLAVDPASSADAVLRPRPTIVLINATAFEPLTLALASAVRARAEPTPPRIIALVDHAEAEARLRAAGCARVLVKPIHFSELDWAMSSPSSPMTTTQ